MSDGSNRFVQGRLAVEQASLPNHRVMEYNDNLSEACGKAIDAINKACTMEDIGTTIVHMCTNAACTLEKWEDLAKRQEWDSLSSSVRACKNIMAVTSLRLFHILCTCSKGRGKMEEPVVALIDYLVTIGSDWTTIEDTTSLLHLAARHDHPQVVHLLRAKMPSLPLDIMAKRTTDGTADMVTPLMEAAANGNLRCCRMLLKLGCDAEARSARGTSVLAMATHSQQSEVVKSVLRYVKSSKAAVQPMLDAVYGGDCASAQLLFSVVSQTTEALEMLPQCAQFMDDNRPPGDNPSVLWETIFLLPRSSFKTDHIDATMAAVLSMPVRPCIKACA